VAAGEWWRLLTYALVHGGALHLLCNSLGHRALGPPIERMIGSVRMLVLWLVSALGGGCAVVLAGEAAIGSSGAVCGLLGAMVALIALNRHHLGPSLTSVLQRWLVNAVFMTVLISAVPGVSWSGHLGGALAGLVAGALLNYQCFGTTWQRWAAVVGLLILPAACVAAVYGPLAVGKAREAQALVAQQQAFLKELMDRRQQQQREAADQQREEADLMQRVAPEVERAITDTIRVCIQHADPLIRQIPLLRDADQVRAALAELGALADELDAANRVVAGAGPYHAANVQAVHGQARTVLAVAAQLTALSREYLGKSAPTNAGWSEQSRQFEIAVRRWRALFPEARPAGAGR
jgi:hypothetical protein